MGGKQATRIMQKLFNKIFVVIHYIIRSPKNTFKQHMGTVYLYAKYDRLAQGKN